jgi:hypothetical protein
MEARWGLLFPLFLPGLALSGYATDPKDICTTSIEPAIIVQIQDSVTGQSLAEGAFGVVSDGLFTDSLRPHGGTANGVLVSLAAADERPGTYTVIVSHGGYANWERTGIQVRMGGCHVETKQVLARLQPTLHTTTHRRQYP